MIYDALKGWKNEAGMFVASVYLRLVHIVLITVRTGVAGGSG